MGWVTRNLEMHSLLKASQVQLFYVAGWVKTHVLRGYTYVLRLSLFREVDCFLLKLENQNPAKGLRDI